MEPGRRQALVWEVGDGTRHRRNETLALEEPLEIRLAGDGLPPEAAASASSRSASPTVTLTVTMRTPGDDFDLVAGFLLAEGVIDSGKDLKSIRYCTDPDLDAEQRFNVVTADLAVAPRQALAPRRQLTSSSCGLCGSASIDAVKAGPHPPIGPGPEVDPELLFRVPELLRGAQRAFASTGGVHGAALISRGGDLLVAREDIGRHNAVDKVLGWAVVNDRLPLDDVLMAVSGRSSFEIVQKAVRGGISIVAGVSAASNLAVDLAAAEGITLVGWLRNRRCLVYTSPERVRM